MAGIVKIHVDDEIWTLKEDISIRLIKCGRERCLSQKQAEGGNRKYYSLHYVPRGEGYLVAGKRKIPVKRGSIFLVRAKDDIVYYPANDNPWTIVWADFVGENLDAVFTQCGLHDGKYCLTPKNERIGKWFEQMLEAHFDKGQLFESAVILTRILYRLVEENAEPSASVINRIVREAIIFINNNYRIPLTLDVIAQSVGVSPNYLVGLFTSEIGISPMKYLTMFKIANACDLLKERQLSIKEISGKVGYKDQLYFSRCFSEIKKVSPREYADKLESDDPWEFVKTLDIDFDDRKGRYIHK